MKSLNAAAPCAVPWCTCRHQWLQSFSLLVKWKKIKWFFCSVEPSSPSRIASALSLDASLPCQFEQDEITGATLVQARAESVKKLSKKLERSVF